MNTVVSLSNGRRGSLLAWDPLRVFSELMSWEPAGSETLWAPVASPVKIHDHDDGSTVTVDLPGVAAEDVDVTFEHGALTITGKRGERTYRYQVALRDTVDPDRIEAELDKGVLTVNAYTKPEARPRKIPLKAAGHKALNAGPAE